jgi:hypothetical protein
MISAEHVKTAPETVFTQAAFQAKGRCGVQPSFGILDSPTEVRQQRPSFGGPLPDDFSGLVV